MSCSKTKTRFIAELSLEHFLLEHGQAGAYFWTFTFGEHPPDEFHLTDPLEYRPADKSWAEERFKPFKDFLVRKGADFLYCWELQQNGRWHIHVLVDKYLDVNFVRPWMTARGWGRQMKVERLTPPRCQVHSVKGFGGGLVAKLDNGRARIVRYITKYLTKSIDSANTGHKKCFGGRARCKCGTTLFKWLPEIRPGSYLYYYGRKLYIEIFGHIPSFWDMRLVMQMGVDETDWLSIDPWYDTS